MANGRGYFGSCGTQTAALAAGKPNNPETATEEYNGSSWTAGGSFSTARESTAAAGTQTAALLFGGSPVPSNGQLTEEYDGSSWTNGGNLGTGRNSAMGTGTQTAGLCAGGNGDENGTELYDGTSWANSTNMSVNRRSCGAAGTQPATVVFAVNSPISGITEEFSLGNPATRTITTT